MKKSIRLLLIMIITSFTLIPLAFAAKQFAPIHWDSLNSQDIITLHTPGSSVYNALISVDRLVGMDAGESINVNCEGQTFVVKPGSAIICKFGNQLDVKPTITFSSVSNNPASGSYQVE